MTEDELTVRAFEIADEYMLSQLTCHCLRGDEHGKIWIPMYGEEEANGINEWDDAVLEALEWCMARGLAEIVDGPDDDMILLKEPYFL